MIQFSYLRILITCITAVCVCVICGPRPVLVRVRWPSRGELGVELVAVVLRLSCVVVVYLPIHKIRVAKYTVLDAVRPVQP